MRESVRCMSVSSMQRPHDAGELPAWARALTSANSGAFDSWLMSDHARKVAYEEWETEHGNFWEQILTNAGLAKTGSTL
jgi:hypothetical protein